MRITGIGNALVDVLVRLDSDGLLYELRLPKGGMTLIDEVCQSAVAARMRELSPRQTTGGSAGNAMLALARLGANPGFVGKVGRDEMGHFFSSCYREMGIDARLIESDHPTGVAHTFISRDGERTFATCLGAAAEMCAEEIVPSLFSGYDLLHIEGYLVQNHELMETICRVARDAGLRLSIDLASYNVVHADLPFFRHLVQDYIDIVFANEEEGAAYTGGKSPMEALEEMAGVCEVAVVKLGAQGAVAQSGGQRFSCTAQHVPVLDTTAAGDFFAGGFLYAYAQGAGLEQCLQCGAHLSERVIQVVGTRLGETVWADIRRGVEGCLQQGRRESQSE